MPKLLEMKKREPGFLADKNIAHESDVFDYIAELHSILWRFVRTEYPNASGNVTNWIPSALYHAELRRE